MLVSFWNCSKLETSVQPDGFSWGGRRPVLILNQIIDGSSWEAYETEQGEIWLHSSCWVLQSWVLTVFLCFLNTPLTLSFTGCFVFLFSFGFKQCLIQHSGNFHEDKKQGLDKAYRFRVCSAEKQCSFERGISVTQTIFFKFAFHSPQPPIVSARCSLGR